MQPRGSLVRSVLLPLLPLLWVPACGGDPEIDTAPPEAVRIAGTYRVEGLTRVIGADVSREISGTLIVAQDGEAYTATFDLETLFPGPDGGALPAQVIGTAEGTIDGTALEGMASTQIVASRVPGIDPGFSMIPPTFGVRVVSTAEGRVKPDGSIEFQLENRGAEGEDYVPTRTTVKGVRVAD